MAKLINGNGNPAIYAAEDADLIASLAGNVTCIANVGSKYAATEEDATTIRLDDGVIITKEGRRIQLEAGESDTFYIPTGTSGQTNYYIIGYKLVQNADSTQVAEQFVQKMNSSSETITEDTFRSGATEVYVSLYRVTQVSFTISSITGLLPELLDSNAAKDYIAQINSGLISCIDAINERFVLPSNTDLNTVKTTGIYYCSGCTNSPSGSGRAWGNLIVIANYNGTDVKQIFMQNNDYIISMRRIDNNAWTSWTTFINPNDRLKTITANLDNIKDSGLYYCSACTNSPGGSGQAWGELIVISSGTDTGAEVKQIWHNNSNDKIATRYYRNGAWSNWYQLPYMTVSGTTLNISL